MYSLEELLFSASLAVYVAASVFIAMVRWGHKCEPYAKYANYYYPGWKTLVFCYLTNLVLLPAVFMPTEADAILLLRMMLILASPFFCAVMLFSYFGKMLKVHWWKMPIVALAVPFALMAGAAFVLTFVPGTQLLGPFGKGFFAAAGMLALVFMACFGTAIHILANAIRRNSEENYSNPEDFPRQFAIGVMCVPILHVAISWAATIIGTLPVMSVSLLVLSALSLCLLIVVLAPHRAKEIDQIEVGDVPLPNQMEVYIPQQQKREKIVLEPERKEEIANAIKQFVEDKQGYLDSHLTLAALADNIKMDRTSVSAVMVEQFGGFFAYVNRCRLAHLAKLKQELPTLSLVELVTASGFGSRQGYYNVLRELEKE